MQSIKRSIPFILLVVLLILFSACSSEALKKPTGLENDPIVEAVELDAQEDTEANGEMEVKEAVENKVTEDTVEVIATEEVESMEDSEEKENKTTEKTTTLQSKANSTNEAARSKNNSSISKTESTSKPKQVAKNQTATTKKSSNDSKKKTDNKTKIQKKTVAKELTKLKEQKAPKKDTVTISIVINSNEVPLGATEIEIDPGDTVLDVFYRVTKKHGIQQSVRGSGGNAYIEGIANVYEFDRGPGSGWMYRVNGIFPDRSVGIIPVQNGDRIELLYTLDLGKDLNANLQPFRR